MQLKRDVISEDSVLIQYNKNANIDSFKSILNEFRRRWSY